MGKDRARRAWRVGAIALALTGCGHVLTPSPGTTPVIIGFIGPLSGPDAANGLATLAAAQLAVDDLNALGGVNGQAVTLQSRDTASLDDAAAGVAAARDLATAGAAVLITEGGATTADVTTQVARPRAIAVITPSAGDSSLATLDDGGYLFRLMPSDTDTARALAQVLASDGQARTIALTRNLTEPRDLAGLLAAQVGTPALTPVFYANAARLATGTLLAAVPATATAGVLLGGVADGAVVLQAFHAAPSAPTLHWYFPPWLKDPALATQLPDSTWLNGEKGVAPVENAGPAYASFKAAYQARTGQAPPVNAARTYDAVKLAAAAMVAAGNNTGQAVHDRLLAVAGAYQSASGAVNLDANGENHVNYGVWRWQSGQPVDTTEVITLQ